MKISIIVAMSENRVIGKDNKLPWHISEDLKRFKSMTMGHPVIMGRKTYESIGKPLPGRHNIVLSRNRTYKKVGVTTVSSLKDALKIFYNQGRGKEEMFIIGGAEVFKEALPKTHRLYLTLIHQQIEGDTTFPEVDLKNDFKIIEKGEPQTDPGSGLSYTFISAERTRPPQVF